MIDEDTFKENKEEETDAFPSTTTTTGTDCELNEEVVETEEEKLARLNRFKMQLLDENSIIDEADLAEERCINNLCNINKLFKETSNATGGSKTEINEEAENQSNEASKKQLDENRRRPKMTKIAKVSYIEDDEDETLGEYEEEEEEEEEMEMDESNTAENDGGEDLHDGLSNDEEEQFLSEEDDEWSEKKSQTKKKEKSEVNKESSSSTDESSTKNKKRSCLEETRNVLASFGASLLGRDSDQDKEDKDETEEASNETKTEQECEAKTRKFNIFKFKI